MKKQYALKGSFRSGECFMETLRLSVDFLLWVQLLSVNSFQVGNSLHTFITSKRPCLLSYGERASLPFFIFLKASVFFSGHGVE